MRSLIMCTATHYCVGDKIDKNEMRVHEDRMGEETGVYRVLVGKPEGTLA
jgi:hypothetical protein